MAMLARMQTSVHQLLNGLNLTTAQAKVVSDLVRGISQSQSVHLSEIGRSLDEDCDLIRTEQRLSRALGKPTSGLDLVPGAWLDLAAPVARKLPFVTVDGSDLTKPYGEAFEHLDRVRDGSLPGKPTRNGYWTVQIEATDGNHRHVPLWQNVYSTKDPGYHGWRDPFEEGMRQVAKRTNPKAIWLLDRGFDDVKYFDFITAELKRSWVIRIKRNRNVIVGDDRSPLEINIGRFAAGLRKPHPVKIEYVNKKTHRPERFTVHCGYAPVKINDSTREYFLIVVTGTQGEDWLLLTDQKITCVADALAVVRAYLQRWGNEEVTRFWKQCTGAEDFRVRSLIAIRRLLFFAMVAIGIQALWLWRSPQMANRLIRRVKQFIQVVLFVHYRLWAGVADALVQNE